MKKILAASEGTVNDIIKSKNFSYAIDAIASDAYNVGYDLEVVGGEIKLTSKGSEAQLMPKIEVKPVMEDGVLYLETELSFPEIKSSELDYADSTEYYLKKWYNVGRFVTTLVKFSFDPKTDYEDDED